MLSHCVPGRAACLWRLYYVRYYTRAALNMSQMERLVGLAIGVEGLA